jgi:hypothetical protein
MANVLAVNAAAIPVTNGLVNRQCGSPYIGLKFWSFLSDKHTLLNAPKATAKM